MSRLRDLLADTGLRAMSRTHEKLLRLSGGKLLSTPFGMPAVTLETVGRKSGLPRKTMLTAPVIDGDTVVLVASKGGDHRNPDWFANILADPHVKLTVEGKTRPMRCRTASAEEKAALWPRIVSSYRGYAGYQKRTSRDIPVVICEPEENAE